MGIISKMLEGMAIGLGIVLIFYLINQIGILGIGEFTQEISSKIGNLFTNLGN